MARSNPSIVLNVFCVPPSLAALRIFVNFGQPFGLFCTYFTKRNYGNCI